MIFAAMVMLAGLVSFGNGLQAGEWADELRVTWDPVEQYDCGMVVAPDNTVYAFWPEAYMKQNSLYLIKSTDFGGNWSSPSMILKPDTIHSFKMAADAAGLHLTFLQHDTIGDTRLFYTKSTDNGATFSTPVQLGTLTDVWQTRLDSGDGKLLVYAKDGTAGHYILVSNDGGATWTEKPFTVSANIWNPAIVLKNNAIHVAFGGFANTPIAYSRSVDDGATWQSPVDVSSGAGPHSQCPTLAVENDTIHVAWEDDRSGSFNVMYTRSTDDGITWSKDLQINDTYYGARVKLLTDSEGVHITWCQYHGMSGWPSNWGSDDYGIIWYKFSGDSGATWSSEFRVSQNESIPTMQLPDEGANYVEFGKYQGGLCACWLDKRDGNVDFYMRNRFSFLTADKYTISAMKGGVSNFALNAGMENAGRNYIILASLTGTQPGTPLPGGLATIPINWDGFTNLVFLLTNTFNFTDFMGTLDGSGEGTAQLNLPALPPDFVGLTMYFAYASNNPWDVASNAIGIEIGL